MKYYLCIALLFLLNFCFAEDYIIEFQAKVKNLKEFDFSNKKKFRNYDLEGTFTDNYGNIGIFNAVVISDVEEGKLIKLDSTGENIYSNNEKIYFRGRNSFEVLESFAINHRKKVSNLEPHRFGLKKFLSNFKRDMVHYFGLDWGCDDDFVDALLELKIFKLDKGTANETVL